MRSTATRQTNALIRRAFSHRCVPAALGTTARTPYELSGGASGATNAKPSAVRLAPSGGGFMMTSICAFVRERDCTSGCTFTALRTCLRSLSAS